MRKERRMMKMVGLTGLAAAMLLLAVPSGFGKTAPKTASGSIVIVFKDGHRQSYNLSEIERVEFSGTLPASEANASSEPLPGRGHYLGKWEVGDGSGNNFFITLREDGTALRSMGDMRGKWAYVDGEARVTWEDGAQDAIRKVGSRYMKFAYSAGKSFSDDPDNTAGARNTTPKPI
jgi:hypothetical protein